MTKCLMSLITNNIKNQDCSAITCYCDYICYNKDKIENIEKDSERKGLLYTANRI